MTGLPRGWVEAAVSEVTTPVPTIDPKAYPETPFTYVDISSIDNGINAVVAPKTVLGRDAPLRARQLLRSGDTVLSTVRTYLRNTAFIDDSLRGSIGSTGFCVLRPTQGVQPRFLFYHSLTHAFVDSLSAQMRGTSYPAVVDGQVRAMRILVPPTAEQERIVARIDELLSRLAVGAIALGRVRRKLTRMRASVHQTAITGQLLPDHGRTRELGVLPGSWRVVTVGDIAAVTGGITKNPKRKPLRNPIPFLRVANVPRDALDLSDVHKIEVYDGELERLRLKNGDLLVVEGNGSPDQIGRSALWHGEIDPCVHQNHLIRVRPGPEILPEYLNLYWNAPRSMELIQAAASSTSGLHTLSAGKIRSVLVSLPPLHVQTQIVTEAKRQLSYVDTLSEVIVACDARLARLRSAILTAAFSGSLVPQNPDDEPAALLLDRIASGRASLAAAKPPRSSRLRSTRPMVSA
jgi:type I restriction enzyme, S subunit